MPHDILKAIVDCTSPAQLPADWSCLQPDPRCRELVADDGSLLACLQNQFADEQLIAANMAQTGEDGQLSLAESLCSDPFFLQTVESDQQFVDLVTTNGAVVSPLPPSFDASRDESLRARLKQWDRCLFAAPDAPELTVLNALGLPIVSSARLGMLTAEELQLLLRQSTDNDDFSTRIANDFAPIHANASRMVIVAWSISELEVDPASPVFDVIEYLFYMKKHFKFDTSFIRVWDISEHSCEGLLAAKSSGCKELIVRALRSSYKRDVKSLEKFSQCGSHISHDYASARQSMKVQLNHARLTGSTGTWAESAIADYVAAFDQAVTQPLIEMAANPRTEPLDRPLLILLANYSKQISQYDPLRIELEEKKPGNKKRNQEVDNKSALLLQSAIQSLHKALSKKRPTR